MATKYSDTYKNAVAQATAALAKRLNQGNAAKTGGEVGTVYKRAKEWTAPEEAVAAAVARYNNQRASWSKLSEQMEADHQELHEKAVAEQQARQEQAQQNQEALKKATGAGLQRAATGDMLAGFQQQSNEAAAKKAVREATAPEALLAGDYGIQQGLKSSADMVASNIEATKTDKQKFQEAIGQSTYTGIMGTINSGYLTNDQREWAEEVALEKASAAEASRRAQELRDEAEALKADYQNWLDNRTWQEKAKSDEKKVGNFKRKYNSLIAQAQKYDDQVWYQTKKEAYAELPTREDFDRISAFVQGRNYSNKYKVVVGLVSDGDYAVSAAENPEQWGQAAEAYNYAKYMSIEEKKVYSALYNEIGEEAADDYFNYLVKDQLSARKEEAVRANVAEWMEFAKEPEQMMLASEKKQYDWLLENKGQEAADKYMEMIQPELKGRKTTVQNLKYVEAAPIRVLASLTSGIGAIDATVQKIWKPGEPVNYGSNNFMPYVISDAIQQQQLQHMDSKTAQWFYQLQTSMEDSSAVVGLSLLGIPGAGVLLGGSAATRAMVEAHERGASDSQAITIGLLAGTAESLFEEISLEKLLSMDALNATMTIKEKLPIIFRNIARQSFAEGSEEINTTLANTITQALVLGDLSDYEMSRKQYRGLGFDSQTADKMAGTDWLMGILNDGLAGAVSGGLMGGGNYIFESGMQAVAREQEKKYQEWQDDIVLMMADYVAKGNYSETLHELAERMAAKATENRMAAAYNEQRQDWEEEELPEFVRALEKEEYDFSLEMLPKLMQRVYAEEAARAEAENAVDNAEEREDNTAETEQMAEELTEDTEQTQPVMAAENAAEQVTEQADTVGEQANNIKAETDTVNAENDTVNAQADNVNENVDRTNREVTTNGTEQEAAELSGKPLGEGTVRRSENSNSTGRGTADVYTAGGADGITAEAKVRSNRRAAARSLSLTPQPTGSFANNGSSRATAILMTQDMMEQDTEFASIMKEAEGMGMRVQGVLGGMLFNDGLGGEFMADAYIQGNTAYISGNSTFTSAENWDHEKTHRMLREDRRVMQALGNWITENYTEPGFKKVLSAYYDHYGKVVGFNTMTTEQQQLYIMEEIMADAMAGTDRFNCGLDNYAEQLRTAMNEATGAERNEANPNKPKAPSMEESIRNAVREALTEAGVIKGQQETQNAKQNTQNAERNTQNAERNTQNAERTDEELEQAFEEDQPMNADEEVRWAISNRDKQNTKARNKNKSTGNVSEELMEETEANIEKVAVKLTEDADKVNLPKEDIKNPIVSNGSYDVSYEPTTVCTRSIGILRMQQLVSERLNRPLTARENFEIAQEAFKWTDMPQCLYCFASLDRMAKSEFLMDYINRQNRAVASLDAGIDAEKVFQQWLPAGADARDSLRDNFNEIYKRWKAGSKFIDLSDVATDERLNAVIRKGGDMAAQAKAANLYAQRASWAKKQLGFRAYNNQIINWSQDKIDTLNSHYGLRINSHSEFSPVFLVEYFQIYRDAAVRGLKVLEYTSDINAGKIFAPTGAAINLSISIATMEDGRMYEDAMQGCPWAEAQALRQEYIDNGKNNVSIVAVALTDAQTEWALAQGWIDVVIPMHLVKTGEEIARYMKWDNTKSIAGDKKTRDWVKGTDSSHIYPSQHNNSKEEYLRLCEENHLTPRFEKYLDNPNYMKLVNETRAAASQLQPVQPVFNMDAAMASIDELEKRGGYGEILGHTEEGEESIADELAEKYQDGPVYFEGNKRMENAPNGRYAISPEQDSRYLQLAENPEQNRAELESMVREAAEKAMPDSVVRDEKGNLITVYHGSSNAGFTEFDWEVFGKFGLFGNGNYFTENKSIAESYTTKGRGTKKGVYALYLNITNPIDMDAKADIKKWAAAAAYADDTTADSFTEGWNPTLQEDMTNEQCFKEIYRYFVSEWGKWDAQETMTGLFEQMGYDGITHMGGGRYGSKDGPRHRVWITFDRNQQKSAEPVTYGTTPEESSYKIKDFEEMSDEEVAERLKSVDFIRDAKVYDEAARKEILEPNITGLKDIVEEAAKKHRAGNEESVDRIVESIFQVIDTVSEQPKGTGDVVANKIANRLWGIQGIAESRGETEAAKIIDDIYDGKEFLQMIEWTATKIDKEGDIMVDGVPYSREEAIEMAKDFALGENALDPSMATDRNVIPLADRFNTAENDIRWAMSPDEVQRWVEQAKELVHAEAMPDATEEQLQAMSRFEAGDLTALDRENEGNAKLPWERSAEDIKNRSIKPYSVTHEQVRPAIRAAANMMAQDLAETVTGRTEMMTVTDSYQGREESHMVRVPIKRQTTQNIARLRDDFGLSYDQITEAVETYAAGRWGDVKNTIAYKAVEQELEQMLMYGYRRVGGEKVNPMPAYSKVADALQAGYATPEALAEAKERANRNNWHIQQERQDMDFRADREAARANDSAQEMLDRESTGSDELTGDMLDDIYGKAAEYLPEGEEWQQAHEDMLQALEQENPDEHSEAAPYVDMGHDEVWNADEYEDSFRETEDYLQQVQSAVDYAADTEQRVSRRYLDEAEAMYEAQTDSYADIDGYTPDAEEQRQRVADLMAHDDEVAVTAMIRKDIEDGFVSTDVIPLEVQQEIMKDMRIRRAASEMLDTSEIHEIIDDIGDEWVLYVATAKAINDGRMTAEQAAKSIDRDKLARLTEHLKEQENKPLVDTEGMTMDEWEGLQRLRSEQAERDALRIRPRSEFNGGPALAKLGVQIAGSHAEYGNIPELVRVVKANQQLEKAMDRMIEGVRKKIGKDYAIYETYANQVAEGNMSMSDVPETLDRATVDELAGYMMAREAAQMDVLARQKNAIEEVNRRLAMEMWAGIDGTKNVTRAEMNFLTPYRMSVAVFGNDHGNRVYDTYFRPVRQNEAERLRWRNKQIDDFKKVKDSKGHTRAASHAENKLIQMVVESEHVDKDLATLAKGNEELEKKIRDEAAYRLKNGRWSWEGEQDETFRLELPENASEEERKAFQAQQEENAERKRNALNGPQQEMAQRLIAQMQAVEAMNLGKFDGKAIDSVYVQNAARLLMDKYSDMYEGINEFLVAHGQKPIGFIKGYAPHQQEDSVKTAMGQLAEMVGSVGDIGNIPSAIAGLTHQYKPVKRWNPFFLHRAYGQQVIYDAMGGFESYVDHMSEVLYHMDDIMRLRKAATYLRQDYMSEEQKETVEQIEYIRTKTPGEKLAFLEFRNKDLKTGVSAGMSMTAAEIDRRMDEVLDSVMQGTDTGEQQARLVTWLDNYTNVLAGKQSALDRGREAFMDRGPTERDKGLQRLLNTRVLNNAMGKILGSNVAMSMSSMMNQTSQIADLTAEIGPVHILRAMVDLFKPEERKSFAAMSDFLTERAGTDLLVEGFVRKADNVLATPAKAMDRLLAQIISKSAYYQGLSRGMSADEALEYSNDMGERIQSSRAKGSKPAIMDSKNILSRLATAFSNEALNTFEHRIMDMPNSFKEMAATKGKVRTAAAIALYCVRFLTMAFAWNRITEEIYGTSTVTGDLLGLAGQYIANGYGYTLNDGLLKLINDTFGLSVLDDYSIYDANREANFEDGWSMEAANSGILYNLNKQIPMLGNMSFLTGPILKNLLGVESSYSGDSDTTIVGSSATEAVGELRDMIDYIKQGEILQALQSLAFAASYTGIVPGMNRQMRKSVQGLTALTENAGYTSKGLVAYPVDGDPQEWIQGILFGKNALGTAQAFYAANGTEYTTLDKYKTPAYEYLVDEGVSPSSAYKELAGRSFGKSQLETMEKMMASGTSAKDAFQQIAKRVDQETAEKEKAKEEKEAAAAAGEATEESKTKLDKLTDAGMKYEDAYRVAWEFGDIEGKKGADGKTVSGSKMYNQATYCMENNLTDAETLALIGEGKASELYEKVSGMSLAEFMACYGASCSIKGTSEKSMTKDEKRAELIKQMTPIVGQQKATKAAAAIWS